MRAYSARASFSGVSPGSASFHIARNAS
jgi:hypothetical protein